MFDVGPAASVQLGEYALVRGARIMCDDRRRDRRLRAHLVERRADGQLPRAGRSRGRAAVVLRRCRPGR